MLSGYVLSFFGGIFADVMRKILLPQSEAFLARFIPVLADERNKRANLQELEVRGVLLALGKDPELARQIVAGSEEFRRRLSDNEDATEYAFIEVEADRIETNAASQPEMNMVAYGRFQIADQLMQSRIEQLKSLPALSNEARMAVVASQKAWEAFRENDAVAEALLTAEGGSMMQMVQSASMEDATVERIARLQLFLELQHL